MILALKRTSPAFIAGRKTVTRRLWTARTFDQWLKRVGTVQDAWSDSPRFHGTLIECSEIWNQWRKRKDIETAVMRFQPTWIAPGITPEQFAVRP